MSKLNHIGSTQADFAYSILMVVFVASFVIAPLLATKLINIAGFIVPAGILAYALTFPCTDIVAEVYGEKPARNMVVLGLIGFIVTNILIQIAFFWPAADIWTGHEAFNSVFGTSVRFFMAGLVAYIISQFADVWIFARIREKMDGKSLWIRNNVSTVLSKLLDMSSFCLIAFWGVYPAEEILSIIWGGWLINIFISFADTPLVYLGVSFLKKANNL